MRNLLRILPLGLAVLVVAAGCEPDESPTAPAVPETVESSALIETGAGITLMSVTDGEIVSGVSVPTMSATSGNGTSIVYSSLGDETWPVSYSYQATGISETGDYIAPTRPGVLSHVDIGMSSWACESGGWSTSDCSTTPGATFTHPITLNLYTVDYSGTDPSPGPLLTSVTQEFEIPYRPSADPDCPDPKKFFDDRFGGCVNGLNTTITFDLSAMDVVVPAEVMIGVRYNTQSTGDDPIGVPGPYNSLNAALQFDENPTIGTSVFDDDLLWEWLPGVPLDLYVYGEGAFEYRTAAELRVTNEGAVTGGGWFTSPVDGLSRDGDGIVSASPDDGWFWNADPPYVTPAGLTTEEASTGSGSLAVEPITNTDTNNEKFILRYVPESPVAISDIDDFSIDFLIDDEGVDAPNQFYINVYAVTDDPLDGSSWYDCRYDYVASSGSTTGWSGLGFTGSTTPTAVTDRLDIGSCPATLGELGSSTLLFLSVNLGDTSGNDTGVGGYFDNASLTLNGSTEVWDFEPVGGRASFGFVSRYKKGANVPTGNTQFTFKDGGIDFHSTSYDWLVMNQGDSNAQFKGEGTVNGEGPYRFMLWAGDHDDGDTFRIRIWDDANGVLYDNGFDQPIEGGQIVIHGEKGGGKK